MAVLLLQHRRSNSCYQHPARYRRCCYDNSVLIAKSFIQLFMLLVSLSILSNTIHIQYSAAFAATNGNNNNNKKSSIAANPFQHLTVTELKHLLSNRNIDFRDCFEKRDLIERLQQYSDQPSSSSSLSSSRRKQQQDDQQEQRTGTITNTDTYRSSSTSNSNKKYTNEESNVIETFKRVAPSVAYITTIQDQLQSSSSRSFSLMEPDAMISGAGSGFLWDQNGHVVTNCHVVMNQRTGQIANRVKVKLQGMVQSYDAIVIGVEPEKDLAVLKIPQSYNLPISNIIDIGTSDDLQVGQTVLAIGNPFGLDNTLTTGVVSALGRDVQGFGKRKIKGCVQTDAAINPGNSGGPLLDSNGRLIGVNTAIYTGGSGSIGNVGIGFAIPVDTVRRVVNQIIRYGRFVRPSLGIHVSDDRMTKSIAMQLGRSMDGVLVAEVFPNSPAEKVGLQSTILRNDGSIVLGDLITHVNDQPVKQVEDLLSAIEERNVGDIVSLRVEKGCNPQRTVTVSTKLVARDKPTSQLQQQQQQQSLRPSSPSSAYSRNRMNRRGGGVNTIFDFW